MSREHAVTIRIMDTEYRVVCDPEQEPLLLTAAERLSSTMRDIRDSGKVLGTERVAVMAALNISYELMDGQQRLTELEQIAGARAQALLAQVDQALAAFEPNTGSE